MSSGLVASGLVLPSRPFGPFSSTGGLDRGVAVSAGQQHEDGGRGCAASP
jgi:hypothetical protein